MVTYYTVLLLQYYLYSTIYTVIKYMFLVILKNKEKKKIYKRKKEIKKFHDKT